MANATKIALANWTKMVVATGGVGDIGLGAVNGYPPIGETLGTNKSFHYVIRAVNNTPLEAGVGVMTDVITLRRDNVYAKMLNGVYSAGDGLTNLSIPVGAFLYTADTKEMLEDLQLELPLRDYGNVSGATGVDLRNSAIKLNLTANATLTFSEPPADGVKHAFTIHATSANAGTVDIAKGHTLTLPANCYKGKNLCPPLPMLVGENVLRLTTANGGDTYQVEVLTECAVVRDLGDLGSTLALDIRHLQTKATFALGGAATVSVTGVSPAAQLDAPAHFSFYNDSDANRVLVFDTNKFNILNSTISTVTVPLGYKADFTVQKNVHSNDAADVYDVWMNGISYNITASGLATTWNPSDSATATPTTEPLPFAITDGNTKIERTGAASSTQNVGKTARAFGGKSSGKHRFSVVLESAFAGGTSQWAALGLGVSTGAVPLTGWFADTATGFAVHLGPTSTSQHTVYKENNNVQTVLVAQAAGNTPTSGTIFSVLVDFDANKIWFARNGVVLGGGNPEAGTGQDFNVTDGAIFFPSIAMSETGAANTGIWKLLNEVSDPYAANFPSFNYWTA